jgi:sugar phosphate isomerase/epimerase
MKFISDRRSVLAGLAVAALTTPVVPALGAARRSFFSRIGRPIGLQLYTLGDEPKRDLDATLRRVAALGYGEIELPEFYGRKPAELKATADKAGLRITCVHLGSFETADDVLAFDSPAHRIADDLGVLGVHQVVLPMAPLSVTGGQLRSGEEWAAGAVRLFTESGSDAWKRTAQLLNERAASLKPFGISVGYHNHNLEFLRSGQETGWEVLVRETDPGLVSFEVDIGWVAAAGLDPIVLLQGVRGRVRQVHVKDIASTTKPNTTFQMDPAVVGTGVTDWRRVLPAAFAAGARNFYVEQEGIVPGTGMAVLARAFGYLENLQG